LPALAVLLWFKVGVDVRSLFALAVAGVAMVVVFVAMLVFFVYRNDPYTDLRGALPAVLGGTRGSRTATGPGAGAGAGATGA